MKQKFLTLFLLLALAIPVAGVRAKDQGFTNDTFLPEESGDYLVAGHPGLKLRVFVYHVRPDKGGAQPAPSLTCNLTDSNSSAVVPGAGWTLPANWSYSLNLNSVPSTVGSDKLAAITANAFSAWSSQVGNKVTVTRANDTTVSRAVRDGQNIVTWGRTSGSALAVSYIWYQNGEALEVDTIFNNKFTWYWSNSTTCAYGGVYDAQNILTHELGHTFGLNDTYTLDYADNTMYGYGSKTEVKKNTLTTGDINGLKTIYGL